MAPAPADYKALTPAGFELVRAALASLTAAVQTTSDNKSNSFVIIASRSISDPEKSPLLLLNKASATLVEAAQLPVDVFRSILAYIKVLTVTIPGLSDPKALADSLENTSNSWPGLDIDGLHAKLKVVAESLSTASAPIAISKAKVKRIGDLMQLLLSPPKKPSPNPNPLEKENTIDAMCTAFAPIFGQLDANSPTDQQTLLSLLGSSVPLANLQTTFSALVQRNKADAQVLRGAWKTLNDNVTRTMDNFNQGHFSAKSLNNAFDGIVMAIRNVKIGITRFRKSFDHPPEDYEKLAADVTTAWTVIGQNVDTYNDWVIQGMPAVGAKNLSPTFASMAALERVNMMAMPIVSLMAEPKQSTDDKTANDVKDAFGPPTYLETVLADMGPTSGKISAALNKYLQLPYASELKVKNAQGAEVSVRDQVVSLKKRYEDLQTKTIPVARDISAYSAISQIFLPAVNQPQGMTLGQLVETQLLVVIKHGKRAKAIAEETSEIRKEFEEFLSMLESNLGQIKAKIEELKATLQETESEYTRAKASAIIEGILTLAFTVGAIVALVGGHGAVAGHLAIHAGISLYQMIMSAIEAGHLAELIEKLKSLIESCEKTKRQLEEVIPIFTDVVDMMQKIGTAWDSISDNLIDVEQAYDAWNNPKIFTPEYLQLTLDSWAAIRTSVGVYVDTIMGVSTNQAPLMVESVASLLKEPEMHSMVPSMAISMSKPAPMVFAASMQMPEVELPNLALQMKKEAAQPIIAAFFSAPKVSQTPIRHSDLINLADSWNNMSPMLKRAGEQRLANLCQEVAALISGQVKPNLEAAVREFLEFARKQPEVPTLPVNEATWDSFYTSRLATLENGRNKATIADASLRNAQNLASNIKDFTLARQRELQQEIDMLNAQEARTWSELERAQSQRIAAVGSSPFRTVFDVAASGMMNLIDSLKRQLSQVQEAKVVAVSSSQQLATTWYTFESSARQINELFQTTAGMSVFWADVTTDMSVASDLWEPLSLMHEQEIQLYRESWQLITSKFADW